MADKLRNKRKLKDATSYPSLEGEIFSRKLFEELRHLQKLLNHGYELEVRWLPKVKRTEKMGNIGYAEKS